jgi:hypothetical protein
MERKRYTRLNIKRLSEKDSKGEPRLWSTGRQPARSTCRLDRGDASTAEAPECSTGITKEGRKEMKRAVVREGKDKTGVRLKELCGFCKARFRSKKQRTKHARFCGQ